MKEVFKMLLSAWSCAVIALFVLWTSVVGDVALDMAGLYCVIWLILFFLAASGVGWLWHRSNEKDRKREGC